MDAHSLAWIDSWTEWQSPPSSSSSYTTNTPLPASDDPSFPSSAPPPLTLDPYSSTDLSYLSPPLSLSYSPNGSGYSNFPSPLDIPRHFPSPLDLCTSDYSTSPSDSPLDTGAPAHLLAPIHDTVPALGFNDFTSDFPALCTSQSPGTHLPISSLSWPSRFPSVAEGSYAPPSYDNMLGLDWSHYNALPPSQVIPSFAPTPTAPAPAVLAGDYVDQGGPSGTSPVSFTGSSIGAVYPSPDALACPPPRTQRVTRARKLTSSTTRSARRTLPAFTPPSLSTHPTTTPSSIKTYKPRRALGTGTPNFTSTTPCGTSYLCTTCHSTYPLTRSSDFTRHVLTHYPEYRGGALLCCGVPANSPQGRALISEGMKEGEEVTVKRYYGRWMVGGCGLLCARTDVLRKHLGNGRRGCVGNLTGDWHPPKLPRGEK